MGFTYTPNTPVASHFPADDQPVMNQNFQYLNSFATRDHQFSLLSTTPNDGTHKQVTLTNLGGTPGFAGASSVVYGKLANGQSQIFFNNALQDVQLTTAIANVPTLGTTGVTFLPGGLLLQWGVSANNSGTFTPNFSTVYTATAVPTTNALSTPPALTSLTNAGLSMTNSSGQAFGIRWMAIGLA